MGKPRFITYYMTPLKLWGISSNQETICLGYILTYTDGISRSIFHNPIRCSTIHELDINPWWDLSKSQWFGLSYTWSNQTMAKYCMIFILSFNTLYMSKWRYNNDIWHMPINLKSYCCLRKYIAALKGHAYSSIVFDWPTCHCIQTESLTCSVVCKD